MFNRIDLAASARRHLSNQLLNVNVTNKQLWAQSSGITWTDDIYNAFIKCLMFKLMFAKILYFLDGYLYGCTMNSDLPRFSELDKGGVESINPLRLSSVLEFLLYLNALMIIRQKDILTEYKTKFINDDFIYIKQKP